MEEFEFKPPKNLQYFLLIPKRLGRVKGRIQLFKIHYLIEKEGLVKYDRSIKNHPLGPVDYSSFDFSVAIGLITENMVSSIPRDYYEISLTDKGEKYFNDLCLPLMNEWELSKASAVIERYKNWWGNKILSYVHSKYVDPFKDPRRINQLIKSYTEFNAMLIDLARKNLDSADDKDQQYILLGQMHHVEKILQKLKQHYDPVNIGSVIWTIYEFHKSLEASKYVANPYTKELFEYLDNYCEKERIHKSIASDDFSDLPEEERERVLKALYQLEFPPSS